MAEQDQHEFVCDLEPRGDGGWDTWISEKPYRGVDTDAVLGAIGTRKRMGGAWTRRWLVVSTRFEWRARLAAASAIRRAHTFAMANDGANLEWRKNHARTSIQITSADVSLPPGAAPGGAAE